MNQDQVRPIGTKTVTHRVFWRLQQSAGPSFTLQDFGFIGQILNVRMPFSNYERVADL
jgi:hypothetical protein